MLSVVVARPYKDLIPIPITSKSMRVDTGGGDGEIDTELSPRSSTITDVAP